MNSRLGLLVFVLTIALGGAASAEEPAPPPPGNPLVFVKAPPNVAPPVNKTWYGGQILIADGAALALMIAGVSGPPALGYLGFGAYLLASPVIHFAHDDPGAGLGSFGLRVALPSVGALVGSAGSRGCSGLYCGLDGAAAGLLVGAGAAILIDVAFLAWHETPGDRPSALRVAPTFQKDGGGLALAMRF